MNIRDKGGTYDSGDVVLALRVNGGNLSLTLENIRPLRGFVPVKLTKLICKY